LACQSGANAAALAALVAAAAPAGAQPAWAHQSPSFQSNGAVTVKSLSGGAYGGTDNPTGTVAKVNQSAITQPPTVIIQATSSAVPQIAATVAAHDGNLGGIAGANAMCVAEFGAGWKMASVGRVTAATAPPIYNYYWVNPPSTSSATCNGWTNGTNGYAGTILTSGSSATYYYQPLFNTQNCNVTASVLCSNF
jgi:hypothetical protein